MDIDPKKIESLDDLRAIMNDPEIKAANKEYSKKYLKANRPKSIMVVIISLFALCGILSLTNLNASDVTPPALRTANEVTMVWQDDALTTDPVILTTDQREGLLDLLSETEVSRQLSGDATEVSLPAAVFTANGNSFSLTRSGRLCVDSSVYEVSDAESFWAQLEELLPAP